MAPLKGKKATEVMKIERESVILTMKSLMTVALSELIVNESDKAEFALLCKRVDYTIRAWYSKEFEEVMQLYALFDPVSGAEKLEKQGLPVSKVDILEQQFLGYLFRILEKSNYKLLSEDEAETASKGQYLLNLPIAVDKSKLDSKLFSTYFAQNPVADLPEFATQYVIFRQGINVDKTSGYFFSEKVDSLIARIWEFFASKLRRPKKSMTSRQPSRRRSTVLTDAADAIPNEGDDANQDLLVERIRIENMDLSLKNFFSKTTIQEPRFERVILIYRKSTPSNCQSKYGERGIHIKQFRQIPMADMELVLPEKKNPGLTPMDWTKLLVSAMIGLGTLITSLEMPKADIRVVLAVLVAVLGYCAKIYFSFQASLAGYQNLITKSMYDKQLDSGRGTLLHMCDDVIQQEVKEVILAYFMLICQGKATKEDLDYRCEQLMLDEFQEKFDFEVEDAIQKMERLGIVTRDSVGRYSHVPPNRANERLGPTTEEKIAKMLY